MESFKLYHNLYSLCSLQVRYTIAIAGKQRKEFPQMHLEEVAVNLLNEGQLDEFFMTKVPALTSSALDKPIADSLEITFYLIKRYPELMPEAYEAEIRVLLRAVHELNYFALSFPDRPQVAAGFIKSIEQRLARVDISAEYRNALKYKLKVTTREKVEGIGKDAVHANEEKARLLMKTSESLLSDDGPWLFGSKRPTVIDAHLVLLIGRLQDVGSLSLISVRMSKYADEAFNTPELADVMEGRRTMFPRT